MEVEVEVEVCEYATGGEGGDGGGRLWTHGGLVPRSHGYLSEVPRVLVREESEVISHTFQRLCVILMRGKIEVYV